MKKIILIIIVLIGLGIGYGFSQRLPKAHEIKTAESIEAKRKYEEARGEIGYIPKFNPYMLAKPNKENKHE